MYQGYLNDHDKITIAYPRMRLVFHILVPQSRTANHSSDVSRMFAVTIDKILILAVTMNGRTKVIAACSVVTIGALAGWWYRRNKRQQPPSKWRAVGKVGQLHIYPLKSGKRVEIEEAECGTFGMIQVTDKSVLKFRDRFLIVYGGEQNLEFKTARTFPKMVLIGVSNHDLEHVALDAPNMRTLYVKIPKTTQGEALKIRMHGKEMTEIVDCGDEAAVWVSRYIKDVEKGLRLGFHDENLTSRKSRPEYRKFYPNIGNNDMGIFSDLTSFMLMTSASVKDLNSRLDKDVTARQFRPNIIVDNVEAPYIEDQWKWIKIGDNTIFRNIKPCTRCVFTTIDAETGIMDSMKEPLRTLKTYRQLEDEEERKVNGNSPVMGVNLGIRKEGNIKLNDIVYVGE